MSIDFCCKSRKVFACKWRVFPGIPVNVIGQYPGMTGPAASTCVKIDGMLVIGKKIQNLFLNLRP
jgi:hypothetical protein